MEKELKAGMWVKRIVNDYGEFDVEKYYEIEEIWKHDIYIFDNNRDCVKFTTDYSKYAFDSENPLTEKPDPFKEWLLSLQTEAQSNENTDSYNLLTIIINEYEKHR